MEWIRRFDHSGSSWNISIIKSCGRDCVLSLFLPWVKQGVHRRRNIHVFLANRNGTYNNCLEVRSFLHLDAVQCILKLWYFPMCLNMAYVFLKEAVMIKWANLRRTENTECTLCRLYCNKKSEVRWKPTDVIKTPTPVSFRLKFNVVR